MAAATAVVHVMTGDDLVADAKLVQGHDVVNGFAFEGVQILDGEHVVLVPFEL